MTDTLKRTPLYQSHVELGGKIVPFAGWELPVQYSGIIAEHQAVRTAAGLFDVSHMGEVFVAGPEAERALEYLTCNRVSALSDGKAQYSALLNERGGVVDDIIIYRFSSEKFLICVNASNSDKDFEWLKSHNKFDALFENQSSNYGQIALQGPAAEKILGAIPEFAGAVGLQYFHFAELDFRGCPVIVARTGYTGEDGFELFVPTAETVRVWNTILDAGKPFGLVPAGLGARDSLRLEACYPLHGHELGDDISALESGLGWIVKLDKGDFLGRAALAEEKSVGSKRTLIGFYVDEAGIARHGDSIFGAPAGGASIGVVTSGTKTPSINRALGMGLVGVQYAGVGGTLYPEVRGKRLKSSVVKKPFYKRA